MFQIAALVTELRAAAIEAELPQVKGNLDEVASYIEDQTRVLSGQAYAVFLGD